MEIRKSLLLFLILVCGVFAFTAFVVSKQVVENVVQDLTWKYSQVAAQYDVERTLSPILEEVKLAQTVAKDPHVVSWARNVGDEVYRSTAEDVLERYRWQFKSKNFFIVLDSDLSYHYNDVQSIRQPSYLRYYLEPESVTDVWYFNQRRQGQHLSVNIAKDIHIDRTKVWINQAIYDNGQFLGIVGTGMDIELFTHQLAYRHTSSLKTLFVDESDRVQLILHSGEFDYPLRNSQFEKPSLDTFIPNQNDFTVLSQFMRKQKAGQEAELLMIEQEGGRAVVAIHYVAELGWYELTFVDVASMLPTWAYTNLSYVFFALSLLLGGFAYYYSVKVWIRPMEEQVAKIRTLADGSTVQLESKLRSTSLESNLAILEQELVQSRNSLQKLVASRTAALDELTTLDVVTRLWNRKGLEQELSRELARSEREQEPFGLIWIDLGLTGRNDIDVNSVTYENTLNAAGCGIARAVRAYDRAARWEDDEFLVLVRAKYSCNLQQLAHRIKTCISTERDVKEDVYCTGGTLAIGGTIVEPGMTEKEALTLADRALYIAKDKQGEFIYIHQFDKPIDRIA